MPAAPPYDALLLLSFGGPQGPDDVMPFLRNVTRGRGIPDERLAEVAEHYHHFDGTSPINRQCELLLTAMRADFADHGLDLPVYWGNRNWRPYLVDTMREMAADGVRRALVLVTSAYASYSGCRQYRENLADAVEQVGAGAPRFDKLRHYFNHPGFVGPMTRHTVDALRSLPENAAAEARLVFVTHSVPVTMNDGSGPAGGAYEAQHRDVAAVIAAAVGSQLGRPVAWDLAYCSRSGPPAQPWLEPDVNDHLEVLRDAQVPGVVVVPIGFVSDHLEVLYDLDVEAAATAERLGLPFARADTVGHDAEFVGMVRALVLERAAVESGTRVDRPCVGGLGPSHDACPVGCCPNSRGPRPALCGDDLP